MTRPSDPADVAAGTDATSSWANSVTDAIQAILADIYGVGSALAIPWANVTGKPSTFAPVLADSVAATTYGVAAAVGVSASGARADHVHGTVPLPTPAQIKAPYAFTTPATAASFRVYVGTSTPTGMSAGDVWIKPTA